MRAINLVTHCLACEGMDENNLKKYNLCESHSEKSNVRKDEEKDLKRFVSNSNFNSFLLYEYYFWNYSIRYVKDNSLKIIPSCSYIEKKLIKLPNSSDFLHK